MRATCWPSKHSALYTIPASSLRSGIAYNYWGVSSFLPSRARPAEVEDNEKENRENRCVQELFGTRAIRASSIDQEDNNYKVHHSRKQYSRR